MIPAVRISPVVPSKWAIPVRGNFLSRISDEEAVQASECAAQPAFWRPLFAVEAGARGLRGREGQGAAGVDFRRGAGARIAVDAFAPGRTADAKLFLPIAVASRLFKAGACLEFVP
jgi:hypothetical protein